MKLINFDKVISSYPANRAAPRLGKVVEIGSGGDILGGIALLVIVNVTTNFTAVHIGLI